MAARDGAEKSERGERVNADGLVGRGRGDDW
jgi:hypothetical protein